MTRYEKIIYKKVFTFEDICELTRNVNTSKSLIQAELDKKHIQKIKHNLYVVCDLQSQKPIGMPYEIGSKITKDAYISYRSALEYYAKVQSTSRIVCISSKRKFENVRFKGYSYKYFNNSGTFGISNKKGIRITDKERTILDCINKPELAGGDENLVNYDVINYCQSRKTKTKYYFNEKTKDNILVSKWGLRVPRVILAGGEEQYW